MKHFISVTDATPEEFNQILTLTEEIKNKRKSGIPFTPLKAKHWA